MMIGMKTMTFKNILQPFFFMLMLAMSVNAYAMTLQQAMGQLGTYKSQGLVGEQPNGYLGTVKNQNDADELVKLINQARLEQYQKMANNNQVAMSDIQALAGQKAIQKTPSGYYIQMNGQWIKK
jgi:uncharacterized protein YdbL (DUF1318 family)